MLQVKMFEPYMIDYLNVSKPKIKDNEVLIKMKRIGICGSDIHVYRGRHKYMSFPIVQGHEGSGTITEIGENVSNLNIGDRVIVQPQFFCGECYPCSVGRHNVCEDLKTIGIHKDGLASEYYATDSSKIIKLPDEISFDQAVMVEPLAVGVHVVKRCNDINNKNVLVLGAGTIGNLVAQSFKAFGANKVIITDIVDAKLDIARQCGIEYCINTKEYDLNEKLIEIFGKYKADIIVDCAGSRHSIEQAIQCSRNAATIVIVANFNEKITFEIPRLQRREIDVITVINYLRGELEEAIDLIKNEKVEVLKLISKYFNIRDFSKAYEFIEKANEVIKVMIKVE